MDEARILSLFEDLCDLAQLAEEHNRQPQFARVLDAFRRGLVSTGDRRLEGIRLLAYWDRAERPVPRDPELVK
jgi:hypothetical protein